MPPIPAPPGGFGTKSTLTSSLAVGMWKMRSFVDFYKRDLGMGNGDDPRFSEFYGMLKSSQDPVVSSEGDVLARPNIVVAHASSYMPDAVSGLTRILGFRGTKRKQNRFGEFETFVFQRATQQVLRSIGAGLEDRLVWAYHVPRSGGRRVPIIGVHRHYNPTEPGKRSRAGSYALLAPEDFGFDPLLVRERAAEKLSLSYRAPVPADLT